MLNKMYYKSEIMGLTNEGCTELETTALLDFFERAMKYTASIKSRQAWFKVKDFYVPRGSDIEDFHLIIKKEDLDGIGKVDRWNILWQGRFESGKKLLLIDAALRK